MNSVAKNLKNIRIKKGYTQDDLAKALNVTCRQSVHGRPAAASRTLKCSHHWQISCTLT